MSKSIKNVWLIAALSVTVVAGCGGEPELPELDQAAIEQEDARVATEESGL